MEDKKVKCVGVVRCRICAKEVSVVDRRGNFRVKKHRFVDYERDPCYGSNAEVEEVKRPAHPSWCASIDYSYYSLSDNKDHKVKRDRRFVLRGDVAPVVVGVAVCPLCGSYQEIEEVGGKLVFPPHHQSAEFDIVCCAGREVELNDLLSYQDRAERFVRKVIESEKFAAERAAEAQRELEAKAKETKLARASLGTIKKMVSYLRKEVSRG